MHRVSTIAMRLGEYTGDAKNSVSTIAKRFGDRKRRRDASRLYDREAFRR
jgi:hypothetical protein